MNAWSTRYAGKSRGHPRAVLSWRIGRCSVVAWVTRNEPKVYIGGEFGDTQPREVEVEEEEGEVLAERFGSAKLRDAAVRTRSQSRLPDPGAAEFSAGAETAGLARGMPAVPIRPVRTAQAVRQLRARALCPPHRLVPSQSWMWRGRRDQRGTGPLYTARCRTVSSGARPASLFGGGAAMRPLTATSVVAILLASCSRQVPLAPVPGADRPEPARHRLAPATQLTAEGKPVGGGYLALGDIDGDGRPDLLVGGDTRGRLAVYRSAGPPTAPRLTGLEWFDDRVPTGRIPEG